VPCASGDLADRSAAKQLRRDNYRRYGERFAALDHGDEYPELRADANRHGLELTKLDSVFTLYPAADTDSEFLHSAGEPYEASA